MNEIQLTGRGIGRQCVGEALVLPQAFTFFGGVDWVTGELRAGPDDVRGKSIAGKVFVFKAPSGGQGTAWKIGEMAQNGSAPVAIVVHRSNNVIVSGCIMASVPLVADLDQDPTALFRSGDQLQIDGKSGVVRLLKRASS